MCKSVNAVLSFLTLVLLFTSCRKKEFDDYYARPGYLADPIYKELQSKGNFSQILACIDKAGYQNILGTAGYWTFFAPNDEAFSKFYQENAISGIDAIDSVRAAGIVSYCLAANSYRKDQLGTLQTSKGPVLDAAYRRRTAYYDFAYSEQGRKGMVVATNRNGAYVNNDNNNKYIPYFLQGYFTANGLSASDYNFFYPNTAFTGFNVGGAKVLTADIPAENGVIHEIDQVITPLLNIEQYVSSKEEYSEFKRLLNLLATYSPNLSLTKKYNILSGKSDSVFVKAYPSTMAFAPNNESYLNVTQTDAQENGWTIVVPTNDALKAFEKELLVNLGSFEAAPKSVLLDLINSHMWGVTVWPKNLLTAANFHNQAATFNNSDIVDKRVLSNGNFYGINSVHRANVFRTVYGKAYLDPKYALMTRAFNQTDLKVASTDNRVKYTLFMMSDEEIKKLGYNFDPDRGQWSYVDPATPTANPTLSLTQDRLFRIAQTSLVSTPYGEFDNLSGVGIAEGFGGEYVKFQGNKVYASGNVAKGTAVTIDSVKTASNGKVYYTKGLLVFAENTETIGQSIERLALSSDPTVAANFNYFYQYLINCAALWSPLTKDIIGAPVGGLYTAFVPTNNAIMQAVKDGLLPGNKTTGVPAFLGASQTIAEQTNVVNFILYHLVEKNTIAVDGKKFGLFPTLFKNAEGISKLLSVYYPGTDPQTNIPGQMELRDPRFLTTTGASVNLTYSNNLGNRSLIHSINKVLNFNQ